MAEETVPDTAAGSPAGLPSLWTGGETHTIEKKALPMYIGSLDNRWPGAFPVYFTDGVSDLPWLDIQDFAGFMGVFFSSKDRKEDSRESDNVMLYFLETGLFTGLMSTNAEEADTVVRDLANVWPDYVISSYERCYDREALAEYIHSLY